MAKKQKEKIVDADVKEDETITADEEVQEEQGEEMSKSEAVAYLKRKGKNAEDDEQVKKVMKEGKIYGDPIAILDF